MRAKSFFYVSAGLLMLAVAYHVTAKRVAANGIRTPVAAAGFGSNFVDEDGQIYRATNDPWPPPTNFVPTDQIPTTSKIVALQELNTLPGRSFAVAENGDIFFPGQNGWSHVANMFDASGAPQGDGPVVDVTVQTSFGATAITAIGNAYDTSNVTTWRYLGNIFGGGPIAIENSSWSNVKDRYRED